MSASSQKTGGTMFMIAGALFLIIAIFGIKIIFFTLGLSLLLIGAIVLSKAKSSPKNKG
ncbi:MAG TPA: hypothetical protein PKY55_05070 [bacterium]|nr:MAG: hypothetical protein BWY83_02603 [bacterium ADurb.Bin478]HNY92818.1 hypothetical protein [bacterium]HOH07579.1 hypothetical protein [bacterium]HOY43928.1 hypothetical protein [bacterium]HPG82625.1 hypothetical protein [bacterium]